MMKAITLASAVAAATAFVQPTGFAGKQMATVKSTSALKMADVNTLVGGRPFGPDSLFDPAGLAEKAESDIELKRYQEAELKHGRVAMLAVLGYLIQESFHPLFALGSDIGPALTHFQLIESRVPWFWEATVFVIGLFEANNIRRGWKPQDAQFVSELKDDYIVGDLGFDPLGLQPDDAEEFETIRTKELNNGRLAMIAIFGLWAQQLVDGQEILQWWGQK